MSKGSVKRWLAKRKQEVVLHLLRGESLDALSRETGQPAAVLSAWREEFLERGLAALDGLHKAQLASISFSYHIFP